MRKTALSLVVLVAVVVVAALAERSLLAGGADKAAPPKRIKLSCGGWRDRMEQGGKVAGLDIKIAKGNWGTIPKAVQTLPPGAELCGALDDSALVISPLFGKALETHYAPLFAKVGCQPFTCEVEGKSTGCKCKGSGSGGRIQTDPDIEGFWVHFIK